MDNYLMNNKYHKQKPSQRAQKDKTTEGRSRHPTNDKNSLAAPFRTVVPGGLSTPWPRRTVGSGPRRDRSPRSIAEIDHSRRQTCSSDYQAYLPSQVKLPAIRWRWPCGDTTPTEKLYPILQYYNNLTVRIGGLFGLGRNEAALDSSSQFVLALRLFFSGCKIVFFVFRISHNAGLLTLLSPRPPELRWGRTRPNNKKRKKKTERVGSATSAHSGICSYSSR